MSTRPYLADGEKIVSSVTRAMQRSPVGVLGESLPDLLPLPQNLLTHTSHRPPTTSWSSTRRPRSNPTAPRSGPIDHVIQQQCDHDEERKCERKLLERECAHERKREREHALELQQHERERELERQRERERKRDREQHEHEREKERKKEQEWQVECEEMARERETERKKEQEWQREQVRMAHEPMEECERHADREGEHVRECERVLERVSAPSFHQQLQHLGNRRPERERGKDSDITVRDGGSRAPVGRPVSEEENESSSSSSESSSSSTSTSSSSEACSTSYPSPASRKLRSPDNSPLRSASAKKSKRVQSSTTASRSDSSSEWKGGRASDHGREQRGNKRRAERELVNEDDMVSRGRELRPKRPADCKPRRIKRVRMGREQEEDELKPRKREIQPILLSDSIDHGRQDSDSRDKYDSGRPKRAKQRMDRQGDGLFCQWDGGRPVKRDMDWGREHETVRDLKLCSMRIPRGPRGGRANGAFAEEQSQNAEDAYANANGNDDGNDSGNGNHNDDGNRNGGGKRHGEKVAGEEQGDKISMVKSADDKSHDIVSPVRAQSGLSSRPILRSYPVEFKNGKWSITSSRTPAAKGVISSVEVTKSGNGGTGKIE